MNTKQDASIKTVTTRATVRRADGTVEPNRVIAYNHANFFYRWWGRAKYGLFWSTLRRRTKQWLVTHLSTRVAR